MAPGSNANVGQFLEADLEGLSIGKNTQHLGSFLVEGVGDTDCVHYVPVSLGRQYPLGLLVVQNGEAPEPPSTDPVNGYEFAGSTQFLYLDFRDALKALAD